MRGTGESGKEGSILFPAEQKRFIRVSTKKLDKVLKKGRRKGNLKKYNSYANRVEGRSDLRSTIIKRLSVLLMTNFKKVWQPLVSRQPHPHSQPC